jgi:predicted dehydrogenase
MAGRRRLVAAGGVEIDVTSSFVEPSESMWYEVHGDSGVLRMTFSPAPFAQQLTLRLEDGASREIEVPRRAEVMKVSGFLGSMGYLDQAAHFLECFASGCQGSGADGVRVLRILLGSTLRRARPRRPARRGSGGSAARSLEILGF